MPGPQVVEGWYGRPFPKSPLTATREYVDVVRQGAAARGAGGCRGPVPLPSVPGRGLTGLGKALKPITHSLRADLPLLLGAEGPKNIAQTTRIADGWLPLYWSPTRTDVYEASLTDLRDDFMIAPMARAKVCDDVAEGLLPVKAMLGFYIGGMGHATRNFHADLMARMGYEAEARHIQERCSPRGARGGGARRAGRVRRRDLARRARGSGSPSASTCGAGAGDGPAGPVARPPHPQGAGRAQRVSRAARLSGIWPPRPA